VLLHHDIEVEYWKLNKALYGLKQAGHEWSKTLQKILRLGDCNNALEAKKHLPPPMEIS